MIMRKAEGIGKALRFFRLNSKLLKSKTISVTSDSGGWASITKSNVGIDNVEQIVNVEAVGSAWAIGRRTTGDATYRILLLTTNSGNIIAATSTKSDVVVYYM